MSKIVRLPGLIDAHVHLRDPSATHKEDFYTGTCAAVAGGVVAVLDMPNNPRPTTNLAALKTKENLAAKKCVCDYGFYFGADQKNWIQHQEIARNTFGLKIYMDYTTGPLLVEKLKVLKKHFEFWPKNKPILVHAEDSTLAKAIALAYLYKKWLHVCHVSQKSELELIKKARGRKVKITCEVTPHHLFLTKKDEQKLKGLAMMRPPLRTVADKQALWQALRKGEIDIIATDHAPHSIKEKKSKHSPFGVPGVEERLPLLLTAVKKKKLSLEQLVTLSSKNPAKLLGIKVKDSWIEVDLDKKWTINNKKLYSKCQWSPYHAWQVQGKLLRVFIRNKKVFENGKVLVKKGFGKQL